MAAFKVNGRDLFPYLRVAHEDNLDPINAEYSEPQFSGAPAFREGQEFSTDAVGNRVWEVPLILKAASVDALYQLIADINQDLIDGAEVEFASSGASRSSFFRLARGRLEVQFQYWIAQASRTRAVLRLWTSPRASTGTQRLIASQIAVAGPQQLPATGILGDSDALLNVEVRAGSAVASAGRLVGIGVHRSASYLAVRGPSGPDFVAQSGATVRGYSGAIGSQALAIPVSPTGASGIALQAFLTPPGGHVGRSRVLAIARSRLDQPITLWARDRFGAPIGATTAASQTDPSKWGVVDLGEVQVPARASGQEAVPTQFLELIAGAPSGAIVNASPALEINRLIFLPLDQAPGLLRTAGGAEGNVLLGDSFARLQNTYLEALPNADGGGQWARRSGEFGNSALLEDGFIHPAGNPTGLFSNASAWYSLGSGAQLGDTVSTVKVKLAGSVPSRAAPSSLVAVKKAVGYTQVALLETRLVLGPSPNLSLIALNDAGATSTLASCGMPSMGASSILAGDVYEMVTRIVGATAQIWLGTAGAIGAANLTVGNASLISQAAGAPELAAQVGNASSNSYLQLDDFFVYSIASAPDIDPREWFRFESYPEGRAFQGNASVFKYDRAAEFRGVHPEVPPVGSPGASGPAQIVVFSGDVDNFVGNDVMDVSIWALERFQVFRS